jgi:DNA-binding NarL/FixJ family response regulator
MVFLLQIVMRVIIADDSYLILEWLQELLGEFGEVEIVAVLNNGTDTLSAVRTLKPDLAILDLKMPGLNGLQVIEEIRKDDAGVKIILMTFFAFDQYRHMAYKAGADYFFSKVDDFEEISKVIAELVSDNVNGKKKEPGDLPEKMIFSNN